MNRIRCKVESLTPFCNTVYKAVLRPERPLEFRAGQYLTVVMADDDKRPFSIASSPLSPDLIELHIGAAVAEGYAIQVVECLKSRETIEIEAPFGEAYLRDGDRPRILVAGGTGFSYVHSMLETLVRRGETTQTYLYWGCRDEDSMYLRQVADDWAKTHPWLTFVPVFDRPKGQARGGTVLDAVCEDFISLKEYDLYIAGRFEMAGAARERFREHGIDEAHLYGDAYAFIK